MDWAIRRYISQQQLLQQPQQPHDSNTVQHQVDDQQLPQQQPAPPPQHPTDDEDSSNTAAAAATAEATSAEAETGTGNVDAGADVGGGGDGADTGGVSAVAAALDTDDVIDLDRMIAGMRLCRNSMVQTEVQYIFIYRAVQDAYVTLLVRLLPAPHTFDLHHTLWWRHARFPCITP